MQGIDHDEMVLNKYSESQLSDLAGNARLGCDVTAKVGSSWVSLGSFPGAVSCEFKFVCLSVCLSVSLFVCLSV